MGKSHDLATYAGGTIAKDVVLGGSTDITMDASSSGQLSIDGNGYEGAIALDGTGMNIYHNSGSRTLSLGTNETARLTIDASGRVTMPYQAHISGSPFGVASDSGVADNFATYKSRGTLSFSNNRVTVPVDGVYLIIFQTIRSRQSGRTDSSIRINGAVYCSSLTAYNADDFGSQTNVASVSLSANDYIQFYNQDWYSNHSGSTPDEWQTASVTLIG